MLDVPYLAHLILVVLEGTPFPAPTAARWLLLGTAAVESALVHVRQIRGPARGFWQIEPATEHDHWQWLRTHKALRTVVTARSGVTGPSSSHLQYNIVYGILMARVHYYRRDPEPMPAAEDIAEMGRRWHLYYKTPAGAGDASRFLEAYRRLILPHFPGEDTPDGLHRLDHTDRSGA